MYRPAMNSYRGGLTTPLLTRLLRTPIERCASSCRDASHAVEGHELHEGEGKGEERHQHAIVGECGTLDEFEGPEGVAAGALRSDVSTKPPFFKSVRLRGVMMNGCDEMDEMEKARGMCSQVCDDARSPSANDWLPQV